MHSKERTRNRCDYIVMNRVDRRGENTINRDTPVPKGRRRNTPEIAQGANLGGNITPIGSASTVVAMTIIHRQKIPLTFTGFVLIASPFALVQIILAIGYTLVFGPLLF